MRAARRRRLRLVLAGLLVAAVAALGAGLLASGKGTSRPDALARAGDARVRARASTHKTTATATTTPVLTTTTTATSTPTTTPATTTPTTPATLESAESPQVRDLIALGKPIYCAGNRGDEVALTFDDGPGTYTKLAIAKLSKHDVKATFFIVGRNIALLPGAIRQERALGAVGDHTWTHPLLTSLPDGLAESEIVRTQGALERASGGPVFLFRPPYGAHDATVDSIAREHNLLEILWTVDSADSLGASYAQIERNVIDGLRPGAIILMHENHGQTIRAMLSIFAALQRKHLRAVSVAKLLTDDPPSEAQVRAGGLGCGTGVSATRGGG